MATTYDLTFNNQTADTWTLVVYVTLRSGYGLASVAWQVAPAPPGGSNHISWTDATSACLANSTTFNGVPGFQLTQSVSAAPDTDWNVTFQNNVQQLVAGTLPLRPGTIQINNVSGRTANPGLGLSGAGAVYKSNVASGLNVEFEPTPQYWVLLADQASAGQVITVSRLPASMFLVFTTPQELNFPSAQPAAVVTASMNGSTLQVDISYPPTTR